MKAKEDQNQSSQIKILLGSDPLAAKIRQLYELRKTTHSRTSSLNWLATRAGIPSKGYLSDVMSGRRILATMHAQGLATAFELEAPATKIFVALVDLERAETPALKKKAESTLKNLQKSLVLTREPPANQMPLFAYDIFGAFGLFNMAPSSADLAKYFKCSETFSKKMLGHLQQAGLVEPSSDGRWRLSTNQHVFVEPPQGRALLEMLRSSLSDAQKKLEPWYDNKKDAFFESVTISVKRDHYQKFLVRLRDLLLTEYVDLESERADEVVRINLQIYPVKPV